MPERSEPNLPGGQPSKRRPGGQPGNRNARTHGGYSAEEPATLTELQERASAASRTGNLALMRRYARLLRERGACNAAYAPRHIPTSTEDDVPRRSSEYMILPERQIAVQPPSTVRA